MEKAVELEEVPAEKDPAGHPDPERRSRIVLTTTPLSPVGFTQNEKSPKLIVVSTLERAFRLH